MTRTTKRRAPGRRRWLLLLAAGILLWLMLTGLVERLLVYYPTRAITGTPAEIGLDYREIHLTAEDGVRLHGWFVPHTGARSTILLFHGNAGNIGHRVPWIDLLHAAGMHVFIIDYRGYGLSEGSPDEAGLYRDARAAYAWWSRERSGEEKLIVAGESLGGAVAVDLASRVRVDGLVLQSTFTSAWDMAKTLMPLGLLQPLTRIRFDSAAKIAAVRCPTLFIHGDRDEIVPLYLGQRLYQLAPEPKVIFEVPGARHNDLLWVAGPAYTEQVRKFVERIERTVQ
ncbi:MAG: alpha/beta hydrolase [Acidobacteriota bacterium]